MRTLHDIMKGIPKETWRDTEWNVEDNRSQIIAMLSARSNFDFPFFAENILGLKLDDFHKEPIQYVYNSRFILIVWPRGHLKTTIWSQAYVIWRLWKETSIEIAITSSALEQSQKIIEEIQQRISDNEFLKELVPKSRLDSWNKSQLTTENKNKCYQKPFNSTSRGTHVDYLICDDILREENLSQEQIKDYFWSIFYPTVQTRGGQIVLVGTPMTTKDLFAEIEQNPKDWKIIKKSCVEVDVNGKWVKSIWKRFKLEELQDIKEKMGSLRFEREYMCNPLGGGANIFKDIRIGKHSELDKPIKEEEYYLGCDIAMESGSKSDFTAFCILGRSYKTGLIKQRKLERYKGISQEKCLSRISELHSKFHFNKVIVENIGLSKGLVKMLEKIPGIPSEGFITNKGGKEELISSINIGFETGVLEILDNTIQYNELIAFKAKEDARSGKITYEGVGEHDDTVIALGLAMLAILSEQRGQASISFI